MPLDQYGYEVTVRMPLASAANTAVVLKGRLQELQSMLDDGYAVGYDVIDCYRIALDAVNKQLPDGMTQTFCG